MLPDQLHLTRVYHRLVVETLRTLDMMIKSHFDARQYQEHLKGTGRGIGCQENVNLPAYKLAPVDSMRLPREDQNYAYYYEPISDHGFGYGLEASTSQPRPQRGFIDFLGVDHMTREATPELAPRWGHSHDDRDPYTDDRFGNEQHRPPSGHVGFVGGSSMHPGPSTDSIRRPRYSSLHTTSNIRVADSSQQYTRFKMSGEYLDPK
ncbi:hypothetical protein SeLEV6574_g07003 [Synchytrium endobioticum]|uniref:Uncharacterized protein n=1 Tax=Synchytrium endobioticum TaxID=286115 RepID=A0A507CJ49_9FUNG|nr:hypothetical protein SeLEV6574_g06999 [Synchytrium endobioticum]TPX39757.1 hypothetical protein SeLEV6574_g07003 [Synchytrium endobioticum]